ncbi:MAG: aspartyl/asparaginyl beta-hydroxylase domain-containing protein [Pseudoxanthomonas sp.]
MSVWILAAILAYWVASVCYVFGFRGRVRYATLSQYMRKSWPIFAPVNCLLYMTTRRHARGPVVDGASLEDIALIRSQWQLIREEALALYRSGQLHATSQPGSAGFHDLGFRTFYKRGWMKFYVKWYGPAHRSAQRLCPETTRIVDQLPSIRGAMFSILPAGAALTLHSDPLACSLRYHLGLDTPNSAHCHINIDGRPVAWRNGEDFVFDETYPHHASNNTDQARIILMCDVERPMHWPGRLLNRLYMQIARGMAVPNTAEDRQGVISRVFERITPIRNAGIRLKQRHRPLYKLLKYVLNLALIGMLVLSIYAALRLFESAGDTMNVQQEAAPEHA